MKKIVIALVVLMLCASFAACGGKKEPASTVPASKEPASTVPASTEPASTEPTEIENKVDLSTDKTNYDKTERIEVTLDFGKLNKEAAVIVIVPTDREHGDESAIHDNYEEYRYLSDFSELPFYMWAPDKEGQFDVRVYENSEGGKELACVKITVGGAA